MYCDQLLGVPRDPPHSELLIIILQDSVIYVNGCKEVFLNDLTIAAEYFENISASPTSWRPQNFELLRVLGCVFHPTLPL